MGLMHSPGAAYGWRARIGLLQPGVVSDTNPYEFYLMAPEGVQMVLTSLGLGGMSEANYQRVIANLETPVERLLLREPDAIIQTGIPPLVHHGWGIEEKLRERVAKLTPIPYITDAAASIAAMRVLNIKRVAVVSGFDDHMVGLIKTYLGHAGIEVMAHGNVHREPRGHSGGLPLEVVYRTARQTYLDHGGEADGFWITEASIPSVGVINELETDLQVPVVTSAQALMWAGLLLAGVREPVRGFGRLFEVQQIAY